LNVRSIPNGYNSSKLEEFLGALLFIGLADAPILSSPYFEGGEEKNE
jgi:hypothetical protein